MSWTWLLMCPARYSDSQPGMIRRTAAGYLTHLPVREVDRTCRKAILTQHNTDVACCCMMHVLHVVQLKLHAAPTLFTLPLSQHHVCAASGAQPRFQLIRCCTCFSAFGWSADE